MKTILQIFLLLLLLQSCKSVKTVRVGEYRNIKATKITQFTYLMRGIKSYDQGSKLRLNNDSTFEMIRCGNIEEGIWRTTNDSIFLMVLSNKWRIDSLNRIIPITCNAKIRIGYKVARNGLERITIQNNQKILDRLEYKSP